MADLCFENKDIDAVSYCTSSCPPKLEFSMPKPPGCDTDSRCTGSPGEQSSLQLKDEQIIGLTFGLFLALIVVPIIILIICKYRKKRSHEITNKNSREANTSSHPLASVCVPCLSSSKSKKAENIQVETYTPNKEATTYVSANPETPEDGLMKPMHRTDPYLEESPDEYGEDQRDSGNSSLKRPVDNGTDQDKHSEDPLKMLSSDTSLVDEIDHSLSLRDSSSVVLSDHNLDESMC